MDKSKQFLKDIGLDFHLQLLAESQKNTGSNIKEITSVKMLCKYTAVMIHMENMFNTFGKEHVMEVIAALKDE